MKPFIHPTAEIQGDSTVGEGTRIWQNVIVLPDVKIGCDCNICANCLFDVGVRIGNNVTIKPGVELAVLMVVEDDVFIGACAVFTNTRYPRSGVRDIVRTPPRLCRGCTIGAGAVLLPNVVVGEGAMIGAGSVVTKNVPPYAIVVGNPAHIVGYVNAQKISGDCGANQVVSGGVIGKTGARMYEIPHFCDLRGDLNVLEFEKILPFPVRRMFYTYNVGSTDVRGEHAHKVCEQFLLAIHGSLHVIVDDGTHREEYVLDSPSHGLHLPAGCWGVEYKHSPDCVLLVLASLPYQSDDYIRNYGEFVEFKRSVDGRK